MTATFTLSAFGDEISDDLAVQLDCLTALDVHYLELRAVWGKNVLELSNEEISRMRGQLGKAGIQVSAIGSPIGKSPLQAPLEEEIDNLRRAFEIASMLDVQRVRVFSFYPPDSASRQEVDSFIGDATQRLNEMTEMAAHEGFTLLLENEKGIVGDTILRCHALLSTIDQPSLRFAWDPANFVQVDESYPTEVGWPMLGEYTAHVHIKDALASGEVTPAGHGAGQVGLLLAHLRESEYNGYLALEPHLVVAGHSGGFSGVDGMSRAVNALRHLMAANDCQESSRIPNL